MAREICAINTNGMTLLKTAMAKLQLSAGAYDRILKVSRTIADLSDSDDIKSNTLQKPSISEVWIRKDGRDDVNYELKLRIKNGIY